MPDRSLSVLLVEDKLDDILLIEEALSELEDLQYSRAWLQPCALVQTESIGETMEVLERHCFDVVLVDINLPDGHAAQALHLIRQKKPDLPVIVLANPEVEPEGIALIRQGAQDCLVKSELDCLPLARAIRFALERQRAISALHSLSLVDELTGFYTEAGFLRVAHSCLSAAARSEQFGIHLFELRGLGCILSNYGAAEADRAVVQAAKVLRQVFGHPTPIGRLAEARFALLTFGEVAGDDLVARVCSGVESESDHRGGRFPLTVRNGFASADAGTAVETVLDEAERALCENSRSHSAASG